MKKYKILMMLFAVTSTTICLFYSCKKYSKLMAVETGTVANVMASGADVDALVVDVGESGLSEYGWCIGITPNPTIEDYKINNGAKDDYGNYTNMLTGLDPGTKYYVRSYISGGGQTVYGEELELVTSDLLFTINHPEANAILRTGQSYDIEWDANINDELKIELNKGDTLSNIIIEKIINNGKYNWTIGTDVIDGDDYKLVISSTENEKIKAETQSFSIYESLPPNVVTEEISNIDYFSAQATGSIEHFGTETSASQHGHCWRTNENPTISDNKTELGSKNTTDNFISELSNLQDNTTYYVRAYSVSNAGIAYGEQVTFTTLNAIPPTVVTSSVTNISYTTASCGGEVANTGTHSVTERGVCWSTTENPNVNDNKITSGDGTGVFTASITELDNSTTYYVRAYAANSAGTAYGDEKSFTTLSAEIPTLSTSTVSNISYNVASCGGEITDKGSHDITMRGVCWSKSPDPSITDNKTTDGIGIGIFESNIVGLEINTTYYVRAFATSIAGTAYGDEEIFITLDPGENSIMDFEGNIYRTVAIGTQIWMAENLRSLKYADGTSISNTYVHPSVENYAEVYGRLYVWSAAMKNSTIEKVQGICPPGWHVPSDNEFQTLVDYLGGESIAGGKLKEAGTSHWNSPNTGATNAVNFGALPAGYYDPNYSYNNLGKAGYFWSSTTSDSQKAWSRNLYHEEETVVRGNTWGFDGISVRCIKDPE